MLLVSLVYSCQHCMHKNYVCKHCEMAWYNISQPFMYKDMRMYNLWLCMIITLLFTSISPHLLPVPSNVTGVSVSKAVKDGKPSLMVTWTALQNDANRANVLEYLIQYSRSNMEISQGNTVAVQPYSTSALLPALLPGTEYNVRVRAVSAAGKGEWSEVHTEATFNSEFNYLQI